MKRAASLAILIGFLVVVGCAPSGYRAYSVDESDIPPRQDSTAVQLYFSTLDSIRPYVHVFPTGMKAEAPNLDPRDFYPPDSLLAKYSTTGSQIDSSKGMLGLPSKRFEIMGEVEVALKPFEYILDHVGIGEDGGIIERDHSEDDAPNKKPYTRLSGVDWASTFHKFHETVTRLQADAVIELFCGKGVSSYWFPPTTHWIPMYGPNGQIVGDYATATPSVELTGWRLIGLAVRWKEDLPAQQ